MKLSRRAVILLLLLFSSIALVAQHTVTLANVRKIYIEKMADNLDQYLASSISKKFHGSVTVVLNKSDADAVLRGVNIGAQSTTQATVQLVDPAGTEVLWSGTGGDRKLLTLDLTHGGQEKIADRLIGELKKAMQR
jgi:hypothetical protein